MTTPSDEINGQLRPLGVDATADAIRAAIGAGPFEDVSVYAPPHRSRMDGKEAAPAPLTSAEFERLRTLPRDELITLGLRPWSEESGLLLFPFEWYAAIPNGFEVVDIFGKTEQFVAGQTDDDCRYGVLAFGIIPGDPRMSQPTKERSAVYRDDELVSEGLCGRLYDPDCDGISEACFLPLNHPGGCLGANDRPFDHVEAWGATSSARNAATAQCHPPLIANPPLLRPHLATDRRTTDG